MASFGMNQMKGGLKILIDGDPYTVLDTEYIKPGKGQAFTRIRVKNLLTGRVTDKTLKSSDAFDGADVVESNMQYLYNDGTSWHFMNPETYEQVSAEGSAMDEAAPWIKEEERCTVLLWNGLPISVSPPNFVDRLISETDPGVRGDTSSGGTKPAKLETGAVVKVPLFIQTGERIRVDTRTGEYVQRVKD
jgi:elongation factor P